MLRFKLQPKDDLSSRADFSLDLMRTLGQEIQTAVQESPEAKAVQEKADVEADIVVSLRSVEVSVRLKGKGNAKIPEADLAKLRKDIGARIHETVRARMSGAIQKSIKSARARM